MKKIILFGVLSTLVSASVYAEETPITQPVLTPPPIAATPAEVKPVDAAPVINCDYKIPAKITVIEQPVVFTWAKNATTQSFNFDVMSLDTQLAALKNCYTEQGWLGFNDALQKSGNLESIKNQKLTVSSQLDGEPTVVESKNNQWKLSIPVQVVYQNSKEKITQLLTVNLTIGRKPSGDLGIMQMIAMPRKSEIPAAPATIPLTEVKPAAPATTDNPMPGSTQPTMPATAPSN